MKYSEYGELVIAYDGTRYWRKRVFPYYKAHRRKTRDDSDTDWKALFDALNRIREELRESFPYRVVGTDETEADDVIATLCSTAGDGKTLILSGDHDFVQLHRFGNIAQFDPVRKAWVAHSDPQAFLREHIIRGDSGDGIPNVLSPDDCFVSGQKQKPLTKQRLTDLVTTDPAWYDPDVKRNFERNRQLIDLSCIPQENRDAILSSYEREGGKDRSKLRTYMMEHRLRQLMESISDF
jgi:hypothetical protein